MQRFNVKLEDEEFDRWKKKAQLSMLSVSEWVRQQCSGEKGKTIEQVTKSHNEQVPKFSSEDIMKAIMEVKVLVERNDRLAIPDLPVAKTDLVQPASPKPMERISGDEKQDLLAKLRDVTEKVMSKGIPNPLNPNGLDLGESCAFLEEDDGEVWMDYDDM